MSSLLSFNDGVFDISNHTLNVYESNIVLTQNYGISGGLTDISSNMFTITNSNINITDVYLGLDNIWTGRNEFKGDISFINTDILINSSNTINLSGGLVNISGGAINISGGPVNIGAAKLASLDVSGNASISGTTTVSGNATFNNTTTQISSTSVIGLSGGVVNISGGIVNISGYTNINNTSTLINSSSLVGISGGTVSISGDIINIGGKTNFTSDVSLNGHITTTVDGKRFTSTSHSRFTSADTFVTFINNDKSGGDLRINTGSPNSNVIIDNGRLGIGMATNPSNTLDISGGLTITNNYGFGFGTDTQTIYLNNNQLSGFVSGQTLSSKIKLLGANQGGSIVGYNTWGTDQGLIFNTNSGSDIERMRIMSNGNVGIGTTNPTQKLDVRGGDINIRQLYAPSSSRSIVFVDDSDGGFGTMGMKYTSGPVGSEQSGTYLSFVTDNTNRLSITKAGNVGIGTTSPSAFLHLNRTIAPNVTQTEFKTSYDSIWDLRLDSHHIAGSRINYYLRQNLNNRLEEVISFDDGNVGIGTTSPGAKMHVNGTIYGNNGSTNNTGLTLSSSGAGWGSGFRLENTTATTGRTWGAYSASNGNYVAICNVTGNNANVLEVAKDTNSAYFNSDVILNNGNLALYNTKGVYFNAGNYTANIRQANFAGTDHNSLCYTSAGDVNSYGTHLFIGGGGVDNGVRNPVTNPLYKIMFIGGSTDNVTIFDTGGNGYWFFNSSGTFGRCTSGGDIIWSITKTGYTTSLAPSDKRIKTNIVDIDDVNALSILRKIQPKTYEYIDKKERGYYTVIGFIAQEIQSIIPNAVKVVKEYIPNIYTTCQFSPTDVSNIVLVTSPIDISWNPLHDACGNAYIDADGNACSDSDGNKVFKLQLKDLSNNIFYVKTISILDKRSFLMDVNDSNIIDTSGKLKSEEYFLYGQEVDDFHTLDKQAIFTVVTAAVQDIDRIVQAQAGQIQAQQVQIQESQTQIQASLTQIQVQAGQIQESQTQIQAQNVQVQAQQTKIQELENKVVVYESRIEELEKQMAAILARLGMN